MKDKLDPKFVALLSLFFLSFIIFVSVVFFNKPLTQLTRATEDVTPTGKNSIMLVWPMSVPADGKSESVINVFVRSANDKPVANRKIVLQSTLGAISEKPIAPEDKKLGKATFGLTSTTTGIAEVKALIDGTIPLERKVTIKFE